MLKLPRAVWLLGWVSFATDAASEAIYPLLPFFLTRVLSAGPVSIGIIEGAAEAVNSVLKILSGRIADRSRTKRPLVLVGYGVSSAVRPLMALAQTWTWVFTVRVVDRVGKGVRGAPRDAMLAGWAAPATRGKVYGFHRAMDHAGAVVGPLLATLFLVIFPDRYRTLFALTIIPGAIAVLLIFLVPEVPTPRDPSAVNRSSGDRSSEDHSSGDHLSRAHAFVDRSSVDPSYVVSGFPPSLRFGEVAPQRAARAEADSRTVGPEPLPPRFYQFIGVLALFALGNSTDAFLLLKLTDAAGSARFVPLMWAALHVVKASVSVVGGSWSDGIGRRAVIAIGWLVYAVVYCGFSVSTTLPALLTWFMMYGFYFGFAEGTEKALVADLAPASRRGTAFGIYDAVSGLGALTASIIFGAVWTAYGAGAAFGLGAGLALISTVLLLLVVPRSTANDRT